jgi:hypothetical protein
MSATGKRFLDTSVVRPMVHGTRAYREHLEAELGAAPCYLSQYVLMEFRRSFILNLVSFYFVLDLPTVTTIGEAMQLWSHRFKSSELKSVMQLVGQLLNEQQLSDSNPRDLEKARLAIGRYIKRVDAKARRNFKDCSKDTTHCGRAAVPLAIDLKTLRESLQTFLDAFQDTKACRARCRIDDVLFARYRTEIASFVEHSQPLAKQQDNAGFLRITAKLESLLDKGPDACTCKTCEAIGDAVIAVDAPRDMTLEHVDRSFDHLCPLLNQAHNRHISEIQFHNTSSCQQPPVSP